MHNEKEGENSQSAIKELINTFLIDPISQEIFVDPVTASDGFCYERQSIEIWLESHQTSPMTNGPLKTKVLYPNHIVYSMLEHLKAKGYLKEKEPEEQKKDNRKDDNE